MRFSKTIKLSAWLLVTVLIALTVPSLRAETFVQAWEQRYASGRGSKVAVDTEGNIIVAGYANMGMGQMDRLIIKYSSNGVGLWTNRWVGSGDSSYTGPGMALGTNGNVYVADFTNYYGGTTHDDFLTIAYSGAGTPLWSRTYNGSESLDDRSKAIAVGASGNVYVTGISRGSGLSNGFDYLTIAYTSAGLPLWTNRYDVAVAWFGPEPYNFDDIAYSVAVDANDNVFVSGVSTTGNSHYENLTVAYSSVGIPLWTNKMAAPAQWTGYHTSTAVDALGAVYVAGSEWQGGVSYIVTVYSNSGTPLWTSRCGGANDCYSEAQGVALDDDGNVYVIGSYYSRFRGAAYTSTGGFLWQKDFRSQGVTGVQNLPCAVAGHNGAGYFTGSVSDDGANYDWLTVVCSSPGTILWSNRYDGPAHHDDRAAALAVDKSGNLYVTGYSGTGPYYYDALTIKYAPAPDITFSAVNWTPDGTCTFSVTAPTNTSFRLQTSGDMTNWVVLTNLPPQPVTSQQYSDTMASSVSTRFYRAVWSP